MCLHAMFQQYEKFAHLVFWPLRTMILTSLFFSSGSLPAFAQIRYPTITVQKTGVTNSFSPDPLVGYRWKSPKATDGLETYTLKPVAFQRSAPASFMMPDSRKETDITVQGTGSIRFDFGRISAGWLEFDSDDLTDSITMSISEYNEPAIVNTGSFERIKTKAPVKHGNTYRLELNPELYEGVRFGWIHVHTFSRPWHIRNVRLVCQVKPVNYLGSFSASDTTLTRIWYTGAYTVKVCLQKDHFGALLVERSDRHSWTGDAYPAQAASMVAFGNFDFVKVNLGKTAAESNGIASYPLYWVLSLVDYANYTGDTTFVRQHIVTASRKLDSAYKKFGTVNFLNFYGWDERLGAGFENGNLPESQLAYSMLSIRAWFEFGSLMHQLGETAIGEKYVAYANEKINEAKRKSSWPHAYGLHAAADAVNTGLTSKEDDSFFYQRQFLDRVNRLSFSPFNQYFVIGAMARMGKHDDALGSVKDLWGGQLNYGGTTFSEVFRPSWNSILEKNDAPPNGQAGYTSLTHPWSAGVVKWLSEEILGIKPVEPGFKTFAIIPHLGNTLSWVKGSTPTPAGSISAAFNTKSGVSQFHIPAATHAKQIWIPLGSNTAQSVYLNKKLVWQAGKPVKGFDVGITEGYFCINHVQPGTYQCKVVYRKMGKPAPAKEDKWNYVIDKFRQDSITTGNWKSRYGSDGFLFFNFKANGQHVQQLPAYLSSFKVRNAAHVHVGQQKEGDKFLQDKETGERQLGAITTKDPEPTLQTMTIDLPVKDSQKHQLALYFVDWDNDNRRSAVEIFDLNTLKLLAPVQLVKNYQNGRYLIFDYSGSLRIRINHVRGKNAALSGIFFDPVTIPEHRNQKKAM